MKKIILSLALASTMLGANAQTMMSKNGTPILPEVGDWSIGIEATPFIDWAMDKSRVFSNTGVTSSANAVNAQMPFTLVGMMVHDATTTYRAKVAINFGSTTLDHSTASDATAGAQVTDEQKTSSSLITLGVGIQKNRGKGRLRGIYGAEFGITFGSPGDVTTSYGNAFSATDHTPTSYDWSTQTEGPVTSRVTENKSGGTFGINLDGFIGVEYFFAPKMSFSAEYNWGLFVSSQAAGTLSTETLNTAGTAGTVTSNSTGKTSNFNVGVNNINSTSTGSIVYHFYF